MRTTLLSLPSRCAAALVLLTLVLPACAPSTATSVKAPDRAWPTYGGTFANTRHADLREIKPDNVGSLKLAWKFNSGIHGQLETTPIVVDGRMYFTTGSDNGVYALDAATGAIKWHYVPKIGRARYVFRVNRGVAVDAGRVFYNTIDNRLIALDAMTGKLIWEKRIGDPKQGRSSDAAPLAWAGSVFVGSAGGVFGARGSYTAYSQKDGKLLWQWWSVAPGWEGSMRQTTAQGHSLHRDIAAERAALGKFRDAWKTGGGPVWMTPALSPQESTIYLSTGNPAPAHNGTQRPGDNLYTDSIVALDARTGKIKWFYQETPHDIWDLDAASPPVLIDALDSAGHRVPAVAEAGKTGWLYILDRKTGHLLRASEPFVPQPHIYPLLTTKATTVEPGDVGGAIAPISYDPAARLAFVAGNIDPETGLLFALEPWRAESEDQWKGGELSEIAPQNASARLSAIDVDTGRIRWSTPVPHLIYGGSLSMNGLVFLGQTASGTFAAYDAANGTMLWQVRPGESVLGRFDVRDRVSHIASAINHASMRIWHRVRHQPDYGLEDIHAPPIAYRINGREYVVIATDVFDPNGAGGNGNTVFAFALPE